MVRTIRVYYAYILQIRVMFFYVTTHWLKSLRVMYAHYAYHTRKKNSFFLAIDTCAYDRGAYYASITHVYYAHSMSTITRAGVYDIGRDLSLT